MSSAQEEADVGPVYEYNEEELDDTPKTQNSKSAPRYDHKTLPVRPREAHDEGSENVEEEEEEDSLTVNGHASVEDDFHLGDQQSGNRVVVHDPILGVERPSSADGSLSIPDDTPSIQVSRSCALRSPY